MASIPFERASGRTILTHEQIEEKLNNRRQNQSDELARDRREKFKCSLSHEEQWLLPSLDRQLSGNNTESDGQSGLINSQKKQPYGSESSHSHSYSERVRVRSRKNKDSSSTSNTSDTDTERSRKVKYKKKHSKRRDRKRSDSGERRKSNVKESAKAQMIDNTIESKRDDWMSFDTLVPTYDAKKKIKVDKSNKCMIAAPGQSERELNPYWKDGGTGLPSEKLESVKVTSNVGDRGLQWYERALKRAQEMATEEGRSLNDVVAERWGSLENLTSLIAQAKLKSERPGRHYDGRSQTIRFKKPGDEFGRCSDDKNSGRGGLWRKRDVRPQRRSTSPSPQSSSKRHERENPECKRISSHSYSSSSSSTRNDRGTEDKSKVKSPSKEKLELDMSEKTNEETSVKDHASSSSDPPPIKILSDAQLNALAAKLLKAEIMGKVDEIEKLKTKLEEARSNREKATESSTSSSQAEETIVLMQTSRSGMSRPVNKPVHVEPRGGRRKDTKAITHDKDGKRARYFADDDMRDLKQMFEQEKFSGVNDDKELFIKMAGKRSGMGSDEEEAAFADAARMCEAEGKRQHKTREAHERAARDYHRALDNCAWCLDSPRRAKHLIVAIGHTCYLCLPSEEPLTPLHCLIVPIQHVHSGVLLEEDVWEEVHKFRKALVSMAADLDQDVVFFEQFRSPGKQPHMVLHCVVISKEVGDTAPIYFKKAIQDSEQEWSNNKKVVDIKGNDVRGTVPKGLPYFAVEFPQQGGFAHIIEDERFFPANFAHSVLGGMMDLDHRLWRKAQKSSLQSQRERTVAFSRKFAKYNPTVKRKRSSSSSSSSSTTSSDTSGTD